MQNGNAARLDRFYAERWMPSPLSNPTRRPRVAHVITRLIVGGAQENTLASVVEHRRRGRFASDLILGPTLGPEGSLVSEARTCGVNPLMDAIALLSLVRVFRRGQYDVVHTHSSKAGILARLAARIARVPVVVHTVHGWGFNDRQRPLVRNAYVSLERWWARFTDALITVTPRDAERGLSIGIGQPGLYTTIRSGIDIARFGASRQRREAVRAELGLAKSDRVVISVMRLTPQKAPLDLIDAVARLVRDVPDARVVIVGDGPLRNAVETRRRELGLGKRLILTGIRRDVPELLSAADVLALSSLWEGLPRVIPQAMAAGLPVVATAIDGSAEAIVHGETGILVPPRDPAALGAALAALLRDPERARAMGEAGRARVVEFDMYRMVDAIEALYARHLGVRGIDVEMSRSTDDAARPDR